MTITSLIYIIGCGVAFIMSFIGFLNTRKFKENETSLLFLSAFCACVLSWAIPIWYLGFKYVLRKHY